MWIAILLIIVSIFSRLIPHVPNFSPLIAVALFSGVYLKGRYSFLIPLAIYIISDLIIGLHNTIIFTWSSIIFIYFLGYLVKRIKTPVLVIGSTFLSSILFFVVTNFGVWIMGWYPRTMEGLITCYILAIPFFRTSLLANLIYVSVLFGAYEFFLRKTKVVVKQALEY